MKPPSPYEYRVDIDRDGYLICDEEGEDVEPTHRYTTWLAAAARLREIVDEEIAADKAAAIDRERRWQAIEAEFHDPDDYE